MTSKPEAVQPATGATPSPPSRPHPFSRGVAAPAGGGGRTPSAPPTVTDYFCDICWDPCELTDAGQLCARHYRELRPVCESCGQRMADIIEHGYYICASCRNGGRY